METTRLISRIGGRKGMRPKARRNLSLGLERLEEKCLLSLSATGTTLTVARDTDFAGQVATFKTSKRTEIAADFKVMIAWGDGTSSAGTVSPNPNVAGGFLVTGSHEFLSQKKNEKAKITIQDDTTGASAHATTNVTLSTATVTDYEGVLTISGMEGQAVSNVLVATFTIKGGGNTAIPFTTSFPAFNNYVNPVITVSAVGKGHYDVFFSGTPLYASMEDSDNTTTDESILVESGSLGFFVVFRFAIADAPLSQYVAPGQNSVPEINAVQGVDTGLVNLGQFVDQNSFATLANTTYKITVNWGDGSQQTQFVNNDNPLNGKILGTADLWTIESHHLYATSGTFTINIILLDTGGQTLYFKAQASVGSGVTLDMNGPFSVNAGQALPAPPDAGGITGYLLDIAAGSIGDYSITVNWGDGNSTTSPTLYALDGMPATDTAYAIVDDHIWSGLPDSSMNYTITVTITGPGISKLQPLTGTQIANVRTPA